MGTAGDISRRAFTHSLTRFWAAHYVIDNVTHASLTYNPVDNVMTCDSL